MSNYDIKVGYACNNNCVHCVVKPNYMNPEDFRTKSELSNTAKELNFSYANLSKIIRSDEVYKSSHITITGGEPTLRKDFIHLIKHINDVHPDKMIFIQTNGRLLEQFVEELYNIDPYIHFVIALHSSDENLHNFIVNNKLKSDDNPYQQTVSSIKKVLSYFPSNNMRTETVISKHNYKNIVDTLHFVKELGCTCIGFSYPHFDGFWINDKDYVYENSVSFEDLKPVLLELVDFAHKNPQMKIFLEAIPFCMLTEDDTCCLPPNIDISTRADGSSDCKLQLPNSECEDYNNDMVYSKPSTCIDCTFCSICYGTWKEALEVYPNDVYKPIKGVNL